MRIRHLALAVLAALSTGACASTAASPLADPSGSAGASPSAADPSSPPSDSPAPSRGPAPRLADVYYLRDNGQLLRLHAGTVSPLSTVAMSATVSPAGTQVAYIDKTATLVVSDLSGAHPRRVLSHLADPGYEPAWSPDSTRVLVARTSGEQPVPGTVLVATGVFTPLPHNPVGVHYLWTADGRHLGYATGTCQLAVADADGSHARVVPGSATSCNPYSVSPDGRRLAAQVQTGEDYDDLGRMLTANSIVDTTTGARVRPPVSGSVTAVLFGADGSTLVRTGGTLTLLDAHDQVVQRVTEPATLRTAHLLGYPVPAPSPVQR